MAKRVDANEVFWLARDYGNLPHVAAEVSWQREMVADEFSEQDLLREAAWVILCSGFRERVVRAKFDYISLCFFDWESAEQIHGCSSVCIQAALRCFRHEGKLCSIATCAQLIARDGFTVLKKRVLENPVRELQRFPFIGPVTAWHLAKNLGIDVAKPDRHLVRLASACGYSTAAELCNHLSECHSEQVKVIDLLLWRYLADHPHFLADRY